MKILAAMSGGVDSAVAAARAVEAGHEVVGVHLALSRMPGTLRTGSRGCCTLEDSMDARRVCSQLGIPSSSGTSPNASRKTSSTTSSPNTKPDEPPTPCAATKRSSSPRYSNALALGLDAVVTGRYARVITTEEATANCTAPLTGPGPVPAFSVCSPTNSSSMPGSPLADTPPGAGACGGGERSFSVAKPDSYDICFIPEGDTRAWLGDHIKMRPGLIKDTHGKVLGEHPGAQASTVGQRRA